MPFKFNCGCGKVLNVKDEHLGKRMKCPQCGVTFTAVREAAIPEKQNERTPRLHVSRSVIIYTSIVVAIPGDLSAWKYGPGRVLDNWAKMEPDAKTEVMDVVSRAIVYKIIPPALSSRIKPGSMPRVHDVTFFISPMPWTMPETIGFAGRSSEGILSGHYYPATGMIEADVEIGGMALPGVTVRHGNTTIHVKGQERNPPVRIEIDGEQIAPPLPK